MLIPSIDLMGGKIVQLVQGEYPALQFTNFDDWRQRFSSYPLVQLIDLDAATGKGNNATLVEYFVRNLRCQVGGGIRSHDQARAILDLGAARVILGSALLKNGEVDLAFAQTLAESICPERLTFAVDTRGGRVAIQGWREQTAQSPASMIKALEAYCGAFLYTHIDSEGLLQGIPMEQVRALREATTRKLIVAGGISSQQEVDELHAFGIDAVVGMAIYTGRLRLEREPNRALNSNEPSAKT